jgi:hypothetical protein
MALAIKKLPQYADSWSRQIKQCHGRLVKASNGIHSAM